MKKLVLLLAVILFTTTAFAQDVAKKTAEIKTSAVCEMCKERIEKALSELDGVISSNLTVETQIVKVDYNPEKTDIDKIREKISDTGYNADNVRKSKKAFKKLPKCCQGDKVH